MFILLISLVHEINPLASVVAFGLATSNCF